MAEYYDYVVEVETRPGMYEQYETNVKFTSHTLSDDEAFRKAVTKLRNSGFTYYDLSMWKLIKVTKTPA